MIYDILLALFVLGSAPKMLWQKMIKKKRFCSLRERFGSFPPKGKQGKKRIWIHAVSVGEIKATEPLLRLLRQRDPTAYILITSSTSTGLEEARRSLSEADLFHFFPLDFSWVMHRWIRSFSPDLLLFIEGDIWPNLIRQAKKAHVKTALVSGKISERSAKRLRFFSFLANRLYGSLDLLSVQNKEHFRRFSSFVERPIKITGNLKLDVETHPIDFNAAKCHFNLEPNQLAITLSCTHAPEEKQLLEALLPLWDKRPDFVLFLAPRHPERFEEVAHILKKVPLSFCRWKGPRKNEQVILVDILGKLPICYSASAFAIVAGSFSSRGGGHNVIEPLLYGCPVLFGPYMENQQEFARFAIASGAGWQSSSQELAQIILEKFPIAETLRELAKRARNEHRGSAKRTIEALTHLHSKDL